MIDFFRCAVTVILMCVMMDFFFFRWPLPSVRSITTWVSGLRIEPSSMDVFLRFLQLAAPETSPLARNCAILFDELSVDSRLCYEQQRDIFMGPHKQAQMIMVRIAQSLLMNILCMKGEHCITFLRN